MTLLAFLFSPLGRYLAVAAAILAAIGAFAVHERNIGAAKIETKIETQNKEATHEADTAERRVRDCYDHGGVYDDATGKCAGP